jgi:hypothetical protein
MTPEPATTYTIGNPPMIRRMLLTVRNRQQFRMSWHAAWIFAGGR